MLDDIVYQQGKIKLGSKLKCDSIVKYAVLREVCQLNIIFSKIKCENKAWQ